MTSLPEPGEAWRGASADEFQPLATGFTLTEAPTYVAERDAVLFSEVREGGVHEIAADGGLSIAIPHRRGIGGFVLSDDSGIVVTGRNVALKRKADGGRILLESLDRIGFNDACADDDGRVYVGGLAWDPNDPAASGGPGGLFLIEPSGPSRLVFEDVVLPNGMAYDAGEGLLFLCDSKRAVVLVLERAADGGLRQVGELRCPGPGRPDGLALSVDGNVWLARAEGGVIDVVDRRGAVLERYPSPCPAVTSIAFGGPAADVLLVSGGSIDGSVPRSGGIWMRRVDATGLPQHRTRIA